MLSVERDRDRDRNTQEGETVPRSGVAARLSPAVKLRSELGASFPSASKRGPAIRDGEQRQYAGRLRQVSRRVNRNGNSNIHAESVHATRTNNNSRARKRRENNRAQRRSGSRNRQYWSASPAYHRGESPLNDASGQQQNANGLRNEVLPFTRPTRHDVATRLLNRTRNNNRTRNGDTSQPNAMKVDGGRVTRNRKRKRLYSESMLPHPNNTIKDEVLSRNEVRKKGRFAKRRRFALRRGAEQRNGEAERFRCQAAHSMARCSTACCGVWRSPAGTLLDRPRISPPANSNEYLINEHNQIDGVSPIVYKATSAHSTATTPFGGTYTFPYTTAYRPDYVEEHSAAEAAHFNMETAKQLDDEAEVSTTSPNGNDAEDAARAAPKLDETQSADAHAAAVDTGRPHATSANDLRPAPRRRAQTNSCPSNSQYDAEFSELYVNTLLDRFQQMNKQELVTQCLSLSGEVELLEARLRDLKKQNDRLARTGPGASASQSNASISNAVSSSALQVMVPNGNIQPAVQSQCSVSSSNVQSDVHDVHVDELNTATRSDENEIDGHETMAHTSATLNENVDTL